MADIQIQIDSANVEKRLKQLKNVKDGAPKATMRAFNRTVTGMKTDAAREITSRYTIAQKHYKDRLSIKKASMSDLSITMSAKDRSIRGTYFNFKPNKDPGVEGAPSVFVKYKKGDGKYTGGFIATMVSTNGITGAFVRTGRFKRATKGAYKGMMREQIETVDGPGVVQMLSNENTRTAIQAKATERFNKELDHQIKYLLDQQKG